MLVPHRTPRASFFTSGLRSEFSISSRLVLAGPDSNESRDAPENQLGPLHPEDSAFAVPRVGTVELGIRRRNRAARSLHHTVSEPIGSHLRPAQGGHGNPSVQPYKLYGLGHVCTSVRTNMHGAHSARAALATDLTGAAMPAWTLVRMVSSHKGELVTRQVGGLYPPPRLGAATPASERAHGDSHRHRCTLHIGVRIDCMDGALEYIGTRASRRICPHQTLRARLPGKQMPVTDTAHPCTARIRSSRHGCVRVR
ncbi:hypothetical protein CERSUDRAFT_117183 [Gelatoporia subvermispora B]|uniref:Uncharacterized protein n=1 Tax=Ceriporiopsis subvermispora (strain B) TaxID=914234 RepID=M2R5X1_CERS8|nr:hypothetical protein CERSUDRAFT_117183 [Gelatoporia subvermispora B]